MFRIRAFKYAALFVVALAVILMAVPALSKEKITVASGWGGTFYDEIEKELVQRFMAKFPDVEVELLIIPDYLEKIPAMAVTGELPDVFPIWHRVRRNFIERGFIMDLTPFVRRDNYNLDAFLPPIRQALSYKNGFWGVPWEGWSVWATQFSIPAFEEAGLELPTSLLKRNAWTFDNLAAAAAKLTKRRADNTLEQIGIYTARDQETIFGWIWGMGGEPFSADGTKCLIHQEAAVQGLEFARQLVHDKGVMSVGVNPGSLSWDDFMAGHWGMNIWWSTVIGSYQSWNLPLHFGQVPFPAGPVSSVTSVGNINSWSVASTTKNPELAWEFIKFMGSSESYRLRLEKAGGLPVRIDDLSEAVRVSESRLGIKDALYFFQALGNQARPYEMPAKDAALFELTTQLEPMWRGEDSVKIATERASQVINAILAGTDQ